MFLGRLLRMILRNITSVSSVFMSFISMVCILKTERLIKHLIRSGCGPGRETCDEVLMKAGMMTEATEEVLSS
jgi:hypothetical protein